MCILIFVTFHRAMRVRRVIYNIMILIDCRFSSVRLDENRCRGKNRCYGEGEVQDHHGRRMQRTGRHHKAERRSKMVRRGVVH